MLSFVSLNISLFGHYLLHFNVTAFETSFKPPAQIQRRNMQFKNPET